jgi:pimeloyl-ACP methyl ester carboxylesterase
LTGALGHAPVRAWATVLAVVAVLVSACTVGPSQRPPVAVRGETGPPAAAAAGPPGTRAPAVPEPEPQRPSMSFFDCTAEVLATAPVPVPAGRALRADCGELVVPIDPAAPGSGRTLVGVLRVGLADAPPDRPPLLVVGDSATDPTAAHAVTRAAQLPDEVLARYTLVGIDRRGFGLDRLDCAPAPAQAAIVDADPAGLALAGLDALLEQARAIAQECNIAVSGSLGGYRSAATAADVERVRAALGVPRLAALGTGDGAGALAVWAREAPFAVGRLVLDGPPGPVRPEPGTTAARAAAAEATLDAFATACSAGDPPCPLGPDPRAAVAALLAALGERPLVADDGRRLTAGGAVSALLAALGEPRRWPGLATALAAARAGDPAGLLAVLAPVTGPEGTFTGELATACNDAPQRLSPPEVAELVPQWRGEYPVFGPTLAHRLLACGPWPARPADPEPVPAPAGPPVLVVGTTADPRTSLDASRRTAETFATGRFVTWAGAGTGAYPRTPCVTAAVHTLLVEGAVPSADTLCPP